MSSITYDAKTGVALKIVKTSETRDIFYSGRGHHGRKKVTDETFQEQSVDQFVHQQVPICAQADSLGHQIKEEAISLFTAKSGSVSPTTSVQHDGTTLIGGAGN